MKDRNATAPSLRLARFQPICEAPALRGIGASAGFDFAGNLFVLVCQMLYRQLVYREAHVHQLFHASQRHLEFIKFRHV